MNSWVFLVVNSSLRYNLNSTLQSIDQDGIYPTHRFLFSPGYMVQKTLHKIHKYCFQTPLHVYWTRYKLRPNNAVPQLRLIQRYEHLRRAW